MYNPLTDHITLREGLGVIERAKTIRHEQQHQTDRKVLLLSLGAALFVLAVGCINLFINNPFVNLAGFGSLAQVITVHVWAERRATKAERKVPNFLALSSSRSGGELA